MQARNRWRWLLMMWAVCSSAPPAAAITIQLDYTYDTGGFFPDGSQARATLQAAAGYFSTILDDTFSAIQTPPPLNTPNGTMMTWQWTMNFNNPSSGASVVLTNPTVAADRYLIYAGAQNLPAPTLGVGGPGGYSWGASGSVHPSDQSQVNQITSDFEDAVEDRGESSGFARWGGTITFDTLPQNSWHFNHTTAPSAGMVDFYSVAIHELAHALGFGERDDEPANVTPWESHISGSSFTGSNATATYGGLVPLDTSQPDPNQNLSHWVAGTNSVIYGTATPQETAMDPDLTNGTRKHFTAVDAAAMKDIGWTVVAPPPLPGVPGDYNDDGIVNAADYVVWRKAKQLGLADLPNDNDAAGTIGTAEYTLWRTNFGQTSGGSGAFVGGGAVPEPGGAVLALFGCIGVSVARRKRRR